MCICQVLLTNLDFQNYVIIRQQISAVIGPARTSKTNSMLRIIYASDAE